MKDFFNDLSDNILERDFIIRVLVPLAGTMVFAFVFYLTSPFVLLMGFLAYAVLFLITNYQKKKLEDSLYYDSENTNPLKEIRQEVLEQIEEPEWSDREEYEKKPSLKARLFARKAKAEYDEYEEEYQDQPMYEEEEPAYEEEPVREAPAKRENQGLRKKAGILPKRNDKEVVEKQELDYDDNFEFEFGSYDE